MDGMIGWRGHFRVFFNTFEDAPLYWCLDDGTQDWQLLVKRIAIRPEVTLTDDVKDQGWPWPKAWFEGEGEVTITNGVAVIGKL